MHSDALTKIDKMFTIDEVEKSGMPVFLSFFPIGTTSVGNYMFFPGKQGNTVPTATQWTGSTITPGLNSVQDTLSEMISHFNNHCI